MPKKFPTTATGGKRKSTPRDQNDSLLEEGNKALLDTHDTEGSRGKRSKLYNASTASDSSTEISSQASTSNEIPEGGRFTYL